MEKTAHQHKKQHTKTVKDMNLQKCRQWNHWESERKWTCIQTQAERELLRENLKQFGFWGKFSVFFFHTTRGYQGLFESSVMFFGAHANAG